MGKQEGRQEGRQAREGEQPALACCFCWRMMPVKRSIISGEQCSLSVSSMRKTNVPPVWRAYAQLNRAVRTIPTWGLPVGEGQKRTRTLLSDTINHRIRQSANTIDGHRDFVARDERANPCGGAGEDDVAGQQRHHGADP